MGTSKKISKLHNKELNIVVNGNQLNNVENEKLLGVHIDNNLTFNKHVDAVCGNITSKVALLNRIKQFLPLHAKKLYFNAYILPIIDYCLTIWGNVPKSQIERTNKLQKRAARIILDAPPDSPSLPLLRELGWLTISERIDYNKSILLYKAVHNMAPSYISDLIHFQSSEFYNLRSIGNNDMMIPRHNTELFKRSFQYSGPQLWNNLPQN